MKPYNRPLGCLSAEPHCREAGFSMIELLMVLLVSTVLTAFALPIAKEVVNSYRLNAAVDSATWAVQSTRFQALDGGLSLSGHLSGKLERI